MTVFAPSIASLYKQIQSYGLDPDPMFEAEGIDPEVMFDPAARVEAEKTDRIVTRAVKLSNDPFFGLTRADYFRPAQLGALGFAWLASPTLRKALERLQRFAVKLHERFEITLEEREDRAFIWVNFSLPSESERTRDDSALALLMKMCRIVQGPGFNPIEVHSIHDQPADSSGYYAYFQCQVEFGRERNGICLAIERLDERLTGSDEQLAKMNDHIVVKYLAHKNKDDIVNRVRVSILEGIAEGRATLLETANDLHMTSRNLTRRLRERDTSFKELLTEIRLELARQYLADQSLSLTEIAFLLGFAELSAFSRAYRRWTGESPSQARSSTA